MHGLPLIARDVRKVVTRVASHAESLSARRRCLLSVNTLLQGPSAVPTPPRRYDARRVVGMDRDALLVAAVRAADLPAVAQALTDGADPDAAAGPFTATVLSEAVSAGRLEIARLLLDAGASLRARKPRYQSPLLSAVAAGHLDVIRLLVDHGALDVEGIDRGSVLAAAIAATWHRPRAAALEVLRYLLELGAEIAPGEEVGREHRAAAG
jgi:hypothetical protein